LEREPRGEQPLDHGVVKIPGDALPVLEQCQLGDACVESRRLYVGQ
jgi:hypothetical protein